MPVPYDDPGTLYDESGITYDGGGGEEGTVVAPRAEGAAAAYNASVSVSPGAQAATSTGTAYAIAYPFNTVNASLASGTGAAYAPAPHVLVTTAVATGTGSAQDAVSGVFTTVYAELVSGTGAAYNATSQVVVNAGLASSTGTAQAASGAQAQVTSASFGLDAEIGLPGGTHDRREYHFGTQDDTTITIIEALGPLPAGTTLDVVLAYLYGNVPEALNPSFGLNAVIYDEALRTFGLNAYIGTPNEDTFGLDAILKGPREDSLPYTFGLDATILSVPEPWNLVRTPDGGTVTYDAIVVSANSVPSWAANGVLFNDFGGDAYRKITPVGAIGDWWQVTWSIPQTIDRVVIYDGGRQSGGGTFTNARWGDTGNVLFSDGSSVPWTGLTNTFVTLDFAPRSVMWLRLVTTIAGGGTPQLTEVEAYNTDQWED